MSLKEPHLKMSKSHQDPKSRILITDTPEVIRSKVMSALTDSMNQVSYNPTERPGISNLLELMSHFDGCKTPSQLSIEFQARNADLRSFKSDVADCISSGLNDIRIEY